VRWHNPEQPGPGALAGRRLPFRFLLALNVIVQRALLQGWHVYDDPAAVRGVIADGHPLADGQGELDLGYPVRVAELLSSSYLREALRLWTAGRRLVQIGQFLAELDCLAVFEPDGKAHLRYPAIGDGGLAVDHHPLDDGSLAEKFFALGIGHLLLAPMMMKQFLNSPGWALELKASNRHARRADRAPGTE
jgi:hypothetical protein